MSRYKIKYPDQPSSQPLKGNGYWKETCRYIKFCLGVVNHSLTITQVSNAQRNASLVELGIVGDELPTPKVPSLKTVSRFQKAKGMQFYSFVEFHQTQFYVPRGRTTKTIMCIKKIDTKKLLYASRYWRYWISRLATSSSGIMPGPWVANAILMDAMDPRHSIIHLTHNMAI